jgi:hypothetical protein
MQNLRSFCKKTDSPSKDLTTDLSSSIFLFLPRFWMTIVGPTVLEIIRTQNRNFECVRRETKKEKKKKKKKKRKTRDALLKCYASHRINKIYTKSRWKTEKIRVQIDFSTSMYSWSSNQILIKPAMRFVIFMRSIKHLASSL